MRLRNFFLSLAAVLAFAGCSNDDDDGTHGPPLQADADLIYRDEAGVRRAEIAGLPDGTLRASAGLDLSGNANVADILSISPGAAHAAVCTFDDADENARNWTGTVEFFNIQTGESVLFLDKSGLTAALNFPNQDAAAEVTGFGWENDSLAVIHIRPRTDFLPVASANISGRFDLRTNQFIELAQSASSEPFAIALPENPEKLRFPHTVEEGVLLIDGRAVSGTGGIVVYDMTFRPEE